MTFIFSKGIEEGNAVENGILDTEWEKPVLVFGAPDTAERFSEFVRLKNSLEKDIQEQLIVEHVGGSGITPEFLSRVQEIASAGKRVIVVCTTTDGATRKQIHELFTQTGVHIFFRVTRYQMLWLQDYLPAKIRSMSLVTLGDLECVINYGPLRPVPGDVATGVLFSALLSPKKDTRFISMSAEALRSMLSVFDHEIS